MYLSRIREGERGKDGRGSAFEFRNVYDKEVYDVSYLLLIIDYCMGTSDEFSKCGGWMGG